MKKRNLKKLLNKKFVVPIIASAVILAPVASAVALNTNHSTPSVPPRASYTCLLQKPGVRPTVLSSSVTANISSNDNYICYARNVEGAEVRTSYITANGQPAYCLDPRLENPNSVRYNQNGQVSQIVANVLAHGYPFRTWSSDNNVNYYITQLAVWACNGDASLDGVGNYVSSRNGIVALNPSDQYIINDAKQLAEEALHDSTQYNQGYSLTTNAPNLTFTKNGDYMVSNVVKISQQGNISGGNYRVDLQGAPSGTQIILAGTDHSQNGFNYDQSFQIKVPISAINSHVNITYNVTSQNASTKNPAHLISNDPNIARAYQSLAQMITTNVTANVSGKGSISPQKAFIQVLKMDSQTGQFVNGCTFGLYQDGKLIQQQTTASSGTEQGMAKFINITPGQYTIRELKAPQGYILSNKTINVDVKAGESKIEGIKFADSEAATTLHLTKIDAVNGDKLSGATFGLFQNGKQIKTVTTDSNGQASFSGVYFGDYQVKEIKAPVGFDLSNQVWNVTVNQQNAGSNNLSYTWKDSPKLDNLNIFKVNKANGDKLSGATFGLFKDGKQIKTATTGSNGEVSFNGIGVGKYTVKELTAPKSFNLSDQVWNVDITPSNAGQTLNYTFQDSEITGQISIIKTDITDSKPVEGAHIKVTCTDGPMKGKTWTWTTGLTPHVINVDWGTYKYEETLAPNGYLINKTVGTATITKQGQVIKADVKDYPIVGKVVINKTGETGKELQGATFGIWNSKGQLIDKLTTGADGKVSVNLRYGDYTVKEINAPSGYSLNPETFKADITKDGTITINVQDNLLPKTGGMAENNASIFGGIALAGAVLLGLFVAIRKRLKME